MSLRRVWGVETKKPKGIQPIIIRAIITYTSLIFPKRSVKTQTEIIKNANDKYLANVLAAILLPLIN